MKVLALAALTALTGCPSLIPFNNKTDDPPPPPLEIDQCAQLCDDAILQGCEIKDCGVDIGRDWAGELDVTVFTLSVSSDGGGSCDLATDCTASACTALFQTCISDQHTLSDCEDQWEICTKGSTCGTSLKTCDDTADGAFDTCEKTTPDLDCEDTWERARSACQCFYDDCLTTAVLDCSDTEADRMAPPPVKTGPYAWTVTRRLIDQQVARASALAAETQVWPVPNAANTHWRGVRLGTVDPQEPLYGIGLRSDDILRTLNGASLIEALRHPSQVLALRNTATIVLGVERAGVVTSFTYHLVP